MTKRNKNMKYFSFNNTQAIKAIDIVDDKILKLTLGKERLYQWCIKVLKKND